MLESAIRSLRHSATHNNSINHSSSNNSKSTTSTNRNNNGSVVGRDASAIDPQFSPDGTMVAFVVAGEIYVIFTRRR